MRRAILWLDENPALLVLGPILVLGLGALGGMLLACYRTGNWDDPPLREFFRAIPLGFVLLTGSLGLATGVLVGAGRVIGAGWGAAVLWAKSPPKVRPPRGVVGVCMLESPLPAADPFMDAARREVEQIAPSDA